MTQAPLIAVIDDDAGMRASLDGLIRSLGYRVALFASAEAFLAAPLADEVQGIVSDFHMPGIDGLSLARRLDAPLRERFILVSSHADEKLRSDADGVGIRYVLIKPFDPDELIACIEAAISN